MTPEQRGLILSLVKVPGRPRAITPEEVLQRFGTSDGAALAAGLLCDAVAREDGTDVEMALIASFVFGVSMEQLDSLVSLCWADWHWSHEDVVTALGELRTPQAVDALFHATQWVPEHLAYDESRALATKAIWALGGTPGPEAEQALTRLLDSDDEILREEAERQLRRRARIG